MAITWRNIAGPNFGSANQLLSQGGNTITKGIESLRGVAQDISAQGTDRFNTQADLNTASILSNINRLDEEGLKNFDVNSLSEQYGSQFDSSGLASALDNRSGDLQDLAQQRLANSRADAALQLDKDNTASNISLNNSRASTAKSLKDKADKLDAFSNKAFSSLGSYNNVEELTQGITKQAVEAGLTASEATNTITSVLDIYNKNIGNTQAQVDAATALQSQANVVNQEFLRKQSETLDAKAKERGLTPIMLGMQDDNTENIDKVYAEFDAASAEGEAIFGKEDSTNYFKQKFTELFDRAPSSAEARYWLSRSFDEGVLLGDDGLDHGNIEKDLASYKAMLSDSDSVNWYKTKKFQLAQASSEAAKAQGDKLKELLRAQRDNRLSTFNGKATTPIKFDNEIFKGTRPDALLNPDWLNN